MVAQINALLRKPITYVVLAIAACLIAVGISVPAHAVSSIEVGGTYIYYYSGSSSYVPDNYGTVKGVSYNKSTKTLTLNKASIKTKDYGIRIAGSKGETVKIVLKGTTTIKGNTNYPYTRGISSDTKLTFKGKNLTIKNCYTGIDAYAATFKSGTYKITGCDWSGISTQSNIKLSGGKFTVKTRSKNYPAIYSNEGKITNSPARLKSIKGYLGKGAKFKKSGSTYKVTDYGCDVTLQKYGSSKKKVNIKTAKYGGRTYYVTAVGAKAFKNKKGAKVTSLSIGYTVKKIGKKAFYGMKKLKTLNVSDASGLSLHKGKAKHIGSKAFSKCGKNNGKSLKVKTGWSDTKHQKKFKKALSARGLSKKAKYTR